MMLEINNEYLILPCTNELFLHIRPRAETEYGRFQEKTYAEPTSDP